MLSCGNNNATDPCDLFMIGLAILCLERIASLFIYCTKDKSTSLSVCMSGSAKRKEKFLRRYMLGSLAISTPKTGSSRWCLATLLASDKDDKGGRRTSFEGVWQLPHKYLDPWE